MFACQGRAQQATCPDSCICHHLTEPADKLASLFPPTDKQPACKLTSQWSRRTRLKVTVLSIAPITRRWASALTRPEPKYFLDATMLQWPSPARRGFSKCQLYYSCPDEACKLPFNLNFKVPTNFVVTIVELKSKWHRANE